MILKFPIKGNFFAFPETALMIPIMERIKITKLNNIKIIEKNSGVVL